MWPRLDPEGELLGQLAIGSGGADAVRAVVPNGDGAPLWAVVSPGLEMSLSGAPIPDPPSPERSNPPWNRYMLTRLTLQPPGEPPVPPELEHRRLPAAQEPGSLDGRIALGGDRAATLSSRGVELYTRDGAGLRHTQHVEAPADGGFGASISIQGDVLWVSGREAVHRYLLADEGVRPLPPVTPPGDTEHATFGRLIAVAGQTLVTKAD